MSIVIIGGGPAGRAAAALLPEATVVTRPQATAFDAEPAPAGWRLWICENGEIRVIEAARIVLAAPDLQLALAFGCAVDGWRPRVDARGRTGVPGLWACGALLGATRVETAAQQGRIVAADINSSPCEGKIAVSPAPVPEASHDDDIICDCLARSWAEIRAAGPLTPAEVANLLHLRAGECRMRRCGPYLGPAFRLWPARPVPILALAQMADDMPATPPSPSADGPLA
jgi:hypothetical protein